LDESRPRRLSLTNGCRKTRGAQWCSAVGIEAVNQYTTTQNGVLYKISIAIHCVDHHICVQKLHDSADTWTVGVILAPLDGTTYRHRLIETSSCKG
jgi:hypothetical protein